MAYAASSSMSAFQDETAAPNERLAALEDALYWMKGIKTLGSGDPAAGLQWYDLDTGQRLSDAPIGISGGLNQYVFCADSPVSFFDPLGMSSVALYFGVYRTPTGTVISRGMAPDTASGSDLRAAAKANSDFALNVSGYSPGQIIQSLQSLQRQGIKIDTLQIWDHAYKVPTDDDCFAGKGGIIQRIGASPLNDVDKMEKIGATVEKEGTIYLMGCWIGSDSAIVQSYANAFDRIVVAGNGKVFVDADSNHRYGQAGSTRKSPVHGE